MKLQLESTSKANKAAHGKLEVMAEYYFDANRKMDPVKFAEYLWLYMSGLNQQEALRFFTSPFIGRIGQLMMEELEEELYEFGDFEDEGAVTEEELNEALTEMLELENYPFEVKQYRLLEKAYNKSM